MLTISQLAAYAGVTVPAVRHYHKIGLLPEPERDHSGYRRYGADAVSRLIRIHALASAGVPLVQVHGMLDADPAEFAAQVRSIDSRLRGEVRRLHQTRARLARLVAGDQLALPDSVVGYLDRLRDLGVDQRYVAMERDAWVILAAQLPDTIDEVMADKHRQLDDPDTVMLYEVLSEAPDWTPEHPGVARAAELIDRITSRELRAGGVGDDFPIDDSMVHLLDAALASFGPATERLLELLAERGWSGWTRLERRAEGPVRHRAEGPVRRGD